MATARFIIEVPRGGLIKWGSDGGIDFVSPAPSPFNYGSLPAHAGADGDPLDAVVLGPRLPRGASGELPIRGRVRFEDGGVEDDKWILSSAPLRRRDRLLIVSFFRAYAVPKRLRDRLKGRPRSRFLNLDENYFSFPDTESM